MYTPHNQRTVTVKMKRIDLCNLMIACASADRIAKENAAERGEIIDRTNWENLYDFLKQHLDELDEKLDDEE